MKALAGVRRARSLNTPVADRVAGASWGPVAGKAAGGFHATAGAGAAPLRGVNFHRRPPEWSQA